jgi:hypothetical protein
VGLLVGCLVSRDRGEVSMGVVITGGIRGAGTLGAGTPRVGFTLGSGAAGVTAGMGVVESKLGASTCTGWVQWWGSLVEEI